MFDASTSHDPDGYITLYEWDWNNDGVYEESHASPTATYSWSDVGNYPVTLQVTDNESTTDTITKTITVENLPPIADFTWSPENPSHGQIISFDASTSYDPDGTITWYQWDWNNDGVYEENLPNPTTTHLWTNMGSYPIKLQVTDDDGAVDTITKTITITNQPPGAPSIDGPTNGEPNIAYQWNFMAVDPDTDDISLQIDWGDGTLSVWYGPYNSGEVIAQSHVYSAEGTYTIKSKAKDIYGEESNWGTLTVTMPCSVVFQFIQFWQHLLERFPNAFPILRHLSGY